MRCMTDHHLKLCRQGCKFCISSLASNGERKNSLLPFFEVSVMFTPSWGIFGSSPALRKRDQTKKRQDASCTFSSEWAMGRKDYYYVVLYFLSLQRVSTSVVGALGMITMSKYYERTLYQQAASTPSWIQGRISNSGTGIYRGQFAQEVHLP